jgi:hypothetical protein
MIHMLVDGYAQEVTPLWPRLRDDPRLGRLALAVCFLPHVRTFPVRMSRKITPFSRDAQRSATVPRSAARRD